VGKGTIFNAVNADGLYTVALDLGQTEKAYQLEQVQGLLFKLETDLETAQMQLQERQAALAATRTALDAVIAAYEGQPLNAETIKSMDALNDALYQARQQVRSTESVIAFIKAQITAAELKRTQLDGLEVEKVVQAWCTDGQPDLLGTVATVEVPGELKGPVLIRPGFFDGATYTPTRDGKLLKLPLQSAAQAYFNAAMLPGWQKYQPTYRFGTITVLNESENLCNVQLEPAVSSAQRLPVNPQSALSGVPIIYRECNARAFREGDSVLIEFSNQQQDSPRVIGFKDYPRSCGVYFCFSYEYGSGSETRYNFAVYDEVTLTRVTDDNRMFEEGNPLYSIMAMGPVLQAGDKFQYVPSFLNYDAGITFANIGTLATSGYPITGDGGRWILQDRNPVTDGINYYGIGDTQTKTELDNADYRLAKINPNTYQISHDALIIDAAEGFAFYLSEPWGGFIAAAGMDEAPTFVGGFWDIFQTDDLAHVKRLYLGDTSDSTQGGALCLSSHGLLVITGNGLIALYAPLNWSEPGGEWGRTDIGNCYGGVLFPSARVESAVSTETDAYFLCDGISSGYFTVRYNYAAGTFENLGFMGASGLIDGGPSYGFIRTHRRLISSI